VSFSSAKYANAFAAWLLFQMRNQLLAARLSSKEMDSWLRHQCRILIGHREGMHQIVFHSHDNEAERIKNLETCKKKLTRSLNFLAANESIVYSFSLF
jgi:hypothetical protein